MRRFSQAALRQVAEQYRGGRPVEASSNDSLQCWQAFIRIVMPGTVRGTSRSEANPVATPMHHDLRDGRRRHFVQAPEQCPDQ